MEALTKRPGGRSTKRGPRKPPGKPFWGNAVTLHAVACDVAEIRGTLIPETREEV